MKEYKVSKKISSRILTAKDLNDFYAYLERWGEEFEYSFPVEDQMRITDLGDDLNYTQGVFDVENVERIFSLY
jgi:hypothetical protein